MSSFDSGRSLRLKLRLAPELQPHPMFADSGHWNELRSAMIWASAGPTRYPTPVVACHEPVVMSFLLKVAFMIPLCF